MFETRNFRLDQDGLKLLRNKFCYRIITFNEILKVEIFWGRKVKNSLVLVLLGFLFMITATLMGVNFWFQLSANLNFFTHLEHSEVRAIGANLIISLSLLASGIWMIINSIQKTVVMKVNHSILVPLHYLMSKGELEGFIDLLQEKIPNTRLDISWDEITQRI